MKNYLVLFLTLTLIACGPSQDEKENIAAVTCAVMGESRNMDGAIRVREMNAAREKIGGEPYLGGDEKIKTSFLIGGCEYLVLSDELYDEHVFKLAELNAKLEAERIERERLAWEAGTEDRRIAAEKQAEEVRIAFEKQKERDRIAAEKRAEEERIAAKELARVIAEYREAANKELSKYKLFISRRELIRNYVKEPMTIQDNAIYVDIQFERTELSKGSMRLQLESISLDFKDSELPDFVKSERGIEFVIDREKNGDNQVSFANSSYSMKPKNRLSRNQHALFVKKFGTGDGGRVYPPKSAFTVIMKVKGIITYSSEPWEFECENFELLRTKNLCNYNSMNYAEFKDPIEIRM